MTKRIVSLCVRALISLGLILILLYIMRGKYAQIWGAIRNANLPVVGLALMAFISAIAVASLRLKIIADVGCRVSLTFREAISLTFIGYFFNNFFPTSIGGDVAKGYYLSRKSSGKLSSFTSVFVDRAMGLVTMIFMAALALLFVQGQFVDTNVRYLIYITTLCALLAVIFILNKDFARKFSVLLKLIRPMEEKLKRVYNAIHLYKNHTKVMLKSLMISVVSQLLFFLSIGILAASIGARIPAMDILLRMPVVSAMSLLPSINGLGVREGSTVLFFGPVIGKESAFVVSILWLLMLFVISIIGGLVYAFSPQFKVKWGDVKEEDAI